MSSRVDSSVPNYHQDTAAQKKCPIVHMRSFPVLKIDENSHKPSSNSKELLQKIGGYSKLLEMTKIFYSKVVANPHLEPFFDTTDINYHAPRLAQWVAEKMGDEASPWTTAREERNKPLNRQKLAQRILVPKDDFSSNLSDFEEVLYHVHDRSSAHFAAWHCPKRVNETTRRMGTHNLGDHFQLDDARVWMRLHFWACREAGLFYNGGEEGQNISYNRIASTCKNIIPLDTQLAFQNYYERLIGHFVRVYERTAPQFARIDSAWSNASTEQGRRNVEEYLKIQRDNPNYFAMGLHGMDDIIGVLDVKVAREQAIRDLGGRKEVSRHFAGNGWPYNDDEEFVLVAGEE